MSEHHWERIKESNLDGLWQNTLGYRCTTHNRTYLDMHLIQAIWKCMDAEKRVSFKLIGFFK